jgi:peroxiredoxin
MARVQLDTAAPDFALEDFRGREVHLSDFANQRRAVLVFNRGFT